jgi:hypothetical protein
MSVRYFDCTTQATALFRYLGSNNGSELPAAVLCAEALDDLDPQLSDREQDALKASPLSPELARPILRRIARQYLQGAWDELCRDHPQDLEAIRCWAPESLSPEQLTSFPTADQLSKTWSDLQKFHEALRWRELNEEATDFLLEFPEYVEHSSDSRILVLMEGLYPDSPLTKVQEVVEILSDISEAATRYQEQLTALGRGAQPLGQWQAGMSHQQAA